MNAALTVPGLQIQEIENKIKKTINDPNFI